MAKRAHVALFLAVFANLLITLPSAAGVPQQSADTSSIIEQGKFTLHKFGSPIGQETYEIRRDGDSIAAKIDFKFTDRGSPVPLTVTFRAAQDLTPQAFEIKGRTARSVSIDEAVAINAGKVHFRTRDKQTDSDSPTGSFFTIAGYAPATMQMLMVRYWASHGSPSQLATLPSGSVKVELRGQDMINLGDRQEILDRYTVEGLIWGRETLWFDSNRKLVAEISTDAEFDHFEAIREGYESGLGDFVGRAGADGMSALAELVWGAFRMPGRTLLMLHELWSRRIPRDEYFGTLVNAYLAQGGFVTGVKRGEVYVDVGTLHGYREAVRILRETDLPLIDAA